MEVGREINKYRKCIQSLVKYSTLWFVKAWPFRVFFLKEKENDDAYHKYTCGPI